MKILVCGGRGYATFDDAYINGGATPDNWAEWPAERAIEAGLFYGSMRRIADMFGLDPGLDVFITGGARGADRNAEIWAEQRGYPVRVYPADWDKHGKKAGPIRNQEMLDKEDPDLVVAFPGGSGTANMISKACRFGVPRVLSVMPDGTGWWHRGGPPDDSKEKPPTAANPADRKLDDWLKS